MSDMAKIIKNVEEKIHQLPFEYHDDGTFDVNPSIEDSMREMGISDISSVPIFSHMELQLELRSLYYVLMRFRNSSSANFKYKTGVNDGKSVDKVDIPKMIHNIMGDLDNQFIKWKSTSYGGTGHMWNMIRRQSETVKE